MKKSVLFITLLSSLILGFLSSCTYGTDGIFYSLENEEKVYTAGGINSNVTPLSMAELGNNLFLAAGPKFYARAKNTVTWNSFTIGGQEYAYAVAQGNSSTLWAVAGPAVDGGSNALYYTTYTGDPSQPSNIPWNSSSSISFTGTPTNLIPIKDSTGVNALGTTATGGCILVTKNGTDYSTVYLITGSSATATPITLSSTSGISSGLTTPSSIGQPITSAAYDGTNYYLANRSYIWKVSGGTAQLLATATYATTAGNDFGAICYVAPASVQSSSLSGGLYAAGIAPAATTTNSYVFLINTTATNSFTTSLSVSLYSYAVNASTLFMDSGALLLGGRGVGYGEITGNLSFSKPTSASTSTSSYYSTVIYGSTITTMFWSKNENKLFMGVSGQGLWSRASDTLKWSLQ